MSTAPPATTTTPLGPDTPADLLGALDAWQEALASRSGPSPVTVARLEDAIVIKADLEALSRRQMSLELSDEQLRLRRRGSDRTIPLWFFEGTTRTEGRRLTITLSPRPPHLVREAAQRAFEPAHRELWRGIERMLDVAESTPLHGALMARVVRALAGAAEQIDERVAAEAVSESFDPLALVRLLEEDPGMEALRDAEPLAPARLRGISARRKLLELAGGALSSDESAEALGLTRQAIDKRRRAGRLLALSAGKRGYRYPAFQFVQGGVLPGLERVLDVLKEQDPWTQLSFFVNRNSDLDSKTPVAVLRAGDIDRVVLAAQASGEQGAA